MKAVRDTTSSTRNSSNAPSTVLIEAAGDLCCNLQPFFDLMEQEIKQHNNTDFDNVEFLVKAVKAEVFKFSSLVEATARSSRKGGAI